MKLQKLKSNGDLTQEEFDELKYRITATLCLIGPAINKLLYSCEDARNYLSFEFKTDRREKDYDVVFRKRIVDANIICPQCGTIKVVDVREEDE